MKRNIATLISALAGMLCISGLIFALVHFNGDAKEVYGSPVAEVEIGDDLYSRFKNPPKESRPRVWWHWMNGNVTEEGVRQDLEWMERVGVAGVQIFDASLRTPQVVPDRLVYMTPAWKAVFKYAVDKASSLDLEIAIAGSPGWSLTGGPWVKPEQAMKKLVWSKERVTGGKKIHMVLPQPPMAAGPYQDIETKGSIFARAEPGTLPEYFRDVAVIAYQTHGRQDPMTVSHEVRVDGEVKNLPALADGNLTTLAEIELPDAQGHTTVTFVFSENITIRSASLAFELPLRFPGAPIPKDVQFEVSEHGDDYELAAEISLLSAHNTASFEAVSGRFFRFYVPEVPGQALKILDMRLHAGALIDRFEEKAGFEVASHLKPEYESSGLARKGVPVTSVKDLTDQMKADGELIWDVPEGEWEILRFGYSLTGRLNGPAAAEATGLEVDKLNAEHADKYIQNYLQKYLDFLSEDNLGPEKLGYMIIDSYEAGPQNWTDNLLTEFQNRRGYDPRPWLPILTGQIINDEVTSNKFLWDFRVTLADLIRDGFYRQLSRSLHQHGMKRYGESHESHRAFIGDGMDAKKSADVPMAAMWIGQSQEVYDADIREAASVAHIYGQNLVAAEAFTTREDPYAFDPSKLKPTADRMMAMGVNRFVIHTSVHQPLMDDGPGLGLGPFGQWFTRNETWAEQAGAWVDYLSRSSYLLQQGEFVADIAYYYGEDTNVSEQFKGTSPNIPNGYNFDYVNSDVVLNEMKVKSGRIFAGETASYAVLVLDPRVEYISLPVLKRFHSLVENGATLIGRRPKGSPSLADNVQEVDAVLSALWKTETATTRLGKGRVYALASPGDVLGELEVQPDVEITYDERDSQKFEQSNIQFMHRKVGAGDIYFINNIGGEDDFKLSLRASGAKPEIWCAQTGEVFPVSYSVEDGRTKISLNDKKDSFFIVMQKPLEYAKYSVPEIRAVEVLSLNDDWQLNFPAATGESVLRLDNGLHSWTALEDPSMKYFSGTAVYSTTFNMGNEQFGSEGVLYLDLGNVKNLAEVKLNGHNLGVLWDAPFRVSITDTIKTGENTLEVEVTNLWPNRMIGDLQSGVEQSSIFTVYQPFDASTPLLPSGMMGPVKLIHEFDAN